MRQLLALVLLAGGLLATPAEAQQQARPYTAVPVTVSTAGSEDPAFATFITGLREAARRRDLAAITRHVAPNFRALGDGGAPRGAPATRFRDAVGLGQGANPNNAADWFELNGILNAREVGPTPETRVLGAGVICGPGQPRFERAALVRAATATRSELETDWSYVIGEVRVRAEARADAAVLTTIRDMAILSPDILEAERAGRRFNPVVLPDGRRGFVAVELLRGFGVPRLCYGKGTDGVWRIVGHAANQG
jgi:hypothetical protein